MPYVRAAGLARACTPPFERLRSTCICQTLELCLAALGLAAVRPAQAGGEIAQPQEDGGPSAGRGSALLVQLCTLYWGAVLRDQVYSLRTWALSLVPKEPSRNSHTTLVKVH